MNIATKTVNVAAEAASLLDKLGVDKALAKAGAHARLVVEKTKSARATVAIAESFQGLAPLSLEGDSLSSSIDSSRGGA